MAAAATATASAMPTATALPPAPTAAPVGVAPTPAEGINHFQQQLFAILATIGQLANRSAHSAFVPPVCRQIVDLCGSQTPEEEVRAHFRPDVIAAIGLNRLARLRSVTGVDLGVRQNLPWVIDEDFPRIDVALMPCEAVRGYDEPSGTPFIALLYSSTRNPARREVEFIYQKGGALWGHTLFGFDTRLGPDDYTRLQAMLDGQQIQGSPASDDTHRVPAERFFLALNPKAPSSGKAASDASVAAPAAPSDRSSDCKDGRPARPVGMKSSED